jgi:hypothetical protein
VAAAFCTSAVDAVVEAIQTKESRVSKASNQKAVSKAVLASKLHRLKISQP